MWDATALDATGNADEVPPTFINLADASVKMVSFILEE
jgi:CCR4-NOT transcriptional complex subunit CAF120